MRGTAPPCCSCRLWNSTTTHHIVRIQRQHLNLQLPPPALPSYPLGRVLGRAGLAPIQDPQGGLRHDDWLTTLQSTPLLWKDFDWKQTHKEQLKEMLSVRMWRWVNNSIMSDCVFCIVLVASCYCRAVCSLPDVSESCHIFSDVNTYGVVFFFLQFNVNQKVFFLPRKIQVTPWDTVNVTPTLPRLTLNTVPGSC